MSRRGMTLLELIVGLAITGVTAAVGYGVFASMVDHQARAEAEGDGVARAAAARRMVIQWLTGARLLVDEAGPPFQGLDGVYQDVPDDELTFLTEAAGPEAYGQTVIRLHIDRDSVTPEQGLTAELTPWRGARAERVEIEPRAAGLDVRYLTRMLGGAEWLPSWISSTVLPVGIEVTLLLVPGDSLPPLLRLPLVVPIGSGR